VAQAASSASANAARLHTLWHALAQIPAPT
jgi:hypothetical protein